MKNNVKLKKLIEYKEALERMLWHRDTLRELQATLTNTTHEWFKDAEDKEFFNRFLNEMRVVESHAQSTTTHMDDLCGVFDAELEEKIKEYE